MNREPLQERMRGKWHGILPVLGVSSAFLNGKKQPCPMCGGRDRARFDDKEGRGTYICNQCGAGNGVDLVMKVNGWDFKTAAQRIESVAGDVEPRDGKPQPDANKLMRKMRERWNSGKPVGRMVQTYLFGRGIDPGDVCDVREGELEMLALMRDAAGNGCQVHRTLLTTEQSQVYRLDRLFMAGPIAKGACVRLMPHDGELGIAEGIETALSAAILFRMPTWAALNASLLKTWEVPGDVKRVVIFADNDENYTGQAAAFELARRLSSRVAVSVELPKSMGQDWNDVLQERASRSQVVA